MTREDREAVEAYDAAKAADNGVRTPLAEIAAEVLGDEPITAAELAEARKDLGHPAA